MDIFSRSEGLLGAGGMKRLAATRVIVFGVGGVGSWCVESLVRSGLMHITIVDDDRVAPSNINRQLPATVETVGELKVEAFRRHLLSVSPDAEIVALHERYSGPTADSFGLERYDVIIDAIDSLRDKALLIERATQTDALFVSSMGAARRLDASRIRMAEFRKVTGCPLARALRERFRKQGRWPARRFECVYSDEPPVTAEKGSLMHITATFGLMMAGAVIRAVTGQS